MASPIANNGPVGDYMVQQDLIYGFNRVDQHYCDALSDADKADFRLYSIGIKLDNNSEPQNSANQRGKKRLHWSQFVQVNLEDYQDIWDGRANPASTVPGLIKAGRKEPDPRLAQQNYELSAAIQKHYDSIPEANVAERRHFQNYAIGRTVVTDRANNDATLEAEIITNWAAQVAKDLTFYQTMGHNWHRRYMWETFPVPHTGPPDGHVCIAATPGDFPLPTANDLLKVRADRTAPGDGRHWRYEKTIYRNPHHHLEPPNNHLAYQRVVHLFASVDDYGQVQDRMAVKVQGEHNLENVRAFVRAEYDVQASLQACDNVLKTRGWSFRNRDSVPPCLGYLYLDWAPHGSLHDLIESAKSRKPEKRQFPEPMLWLIFRGLAECLHMMHTGRTVAHNEPTFADRLMSNANLPRAAGWRPLTNVDIKLRNVVIGRPTPHWYASYKTALMIDFGHTAHNKYPNKASKLQSARPVRYKGIGTQGCRPPEQFQPPPANRRNTPIDVRASIWNTGKIMYELMNQEFYNLSDPKIDIFKPSATFLGRRFRYWPELEILVRTCLAADPDARPQLNEILWASADGLEKWEQTAMRVSGPDVPTDMLWEWKKEDFALDAVVPKHWHWHARKRPGHDDKSSEDDDGPLDTRRPSSNHESESDGEFGDESYRPGTAEQIMERRRRHVADPVVAPRDGGAASGPPSSRRLSSSEQSEGEFGGESFRPSTTQEVTKEIEEARRVRGGPALIAAPGVGDAVALDGRTAVDERVPGAKRKSSEDGGGRSKRIRRSR